MKIKKTEKKNATDKLFHRLVDDKYRYYYQLVIVSAVLGVTSSVMTVMNIFTHKTVLMWATLIFAVVCFVNCGIARMYKRARLVSSLILEGSIIALFAFFLVTGGTEGFSPIWICVLPSCGLLLFGEKKGTAICAVMFAIIVFLFWIPLGNSLLAYEYTQEYLMRFPVVYICFYALGFTFERVRRTTYDELREMREKYRELSYVDTLTQLHNRCWFGANIASALHDGGVGTAMIDIDRFKSFNDRHGHAFGDAVLASVASTIRDIAEEYGGETCRWGGEEFLIMLNIASENATAAMCEKIRRTVEDTHFSTDDGEDAVTVSIGYVYDGDYASDRQQPLIKAADDELYRAKETGRNRVCGHTNK